MKIDLNDAEAGKVAGAAVVFVLTAVFGKDWAATIARWLRIRGAEKTPIVPPAASTTPAHTLPVDEVSEALGGLMRSKFRAEDSTIQMLVARAERAEAAESTAVEEKRKAIEQAQRDVEAAREDVHEVRNSALVSIAAAAKDANAGIVRSRHAAEAKIRIAEGKVEVLMDKLRERDAALAARDVLNATLTEQHRSCHDANVRLTADNAALLERLDRVLQRGKWDPSTHTNLGSGLDEPKP